MCHKADWFFEDLTGIFLRAAAIQLHVYCSKTIACDLQMAINVSSCLSSRYRKKKLGVSIFWDWENQPVKTSVTLEQMKEKLQEVLEARNVLKSGEDMPVIEVYSNPKVCERFLDEWSAGFSYNRTPKGKNECDYEILKDMIQWHLRLKWNEQTCPLCQLALKLIIQMSQKTTQVVATMVKKMISHDKEKIQKFWEGVESFFETKPDPAGYASQVVLISVLKLIIQILQKTTQEVATMVEKMMSHDKEKIEKFWEGVESLFETDPDPASYASHVVLISEDYINRSTLRYLKTQGHHKTVVITRHKKNQLLDVTDVHIIWDGECTFQQVKVPSKFYFMLYYIHYLQMN